MSVCDTVMPLETTPTIYSDSALAWKLTLLDEDGAAFVVDTGSTVQAALLSLTKAVLIGPVSSLENDVDADWPNGVIVVRWTKLQAASLDEQDGYLEVKIGDGQPVQKLVHIEEVGIT